jgi:hypothetical protein
MPEGDLGGVGEACPQGYPQQLWKTKKPFGGNALDAIADE